MRWAWLTVLLLGCSEGSDNSVHCFDQQKKSTVTLPAFTQTNCPTIADTVTNAPPTQTGTAVSP